MLTTSEGSRKTMLVLLKPALLTCGIGLSTLFGLIQTSTVAWTSAEDSAGLSGIIAPEPPTGLWEDDFLTMGETWEEWGLDAAEDVMNLYAIEEDTPIAEQTAALDKIAERLATIEAALDDDAYASIHTPLATLYGKLKPRYDLTKAILDTLKMNPAQAKIDKLAADQKAIGNQLAKTIAYLKELNGGDAWIEYLELSAAKSSIDEAATPKDVLQAINPVVQKINKRGELEDEVQQKFLGRLPFVTLVETAKTYRQTNGMKIEKKDMSALRAEMTKLVAAVEGYHETHASADAKAANSALEAVKAQAPDGGAAIDAAMRAHYLNYNLHVVVHEDFLDKMIREEESEKGKVRDYVLGASVSGNQSTTTRIGLDLKPSDSGILFDVVLSGTTRTDTAGRTSQATIYTAGRHTFTGRKEVLFDGDTFDIKPARVSVKARNSTVGARTRLSGVPIFGGIAKGIAMGEARKRRGQSEAIARKKIIERVEPEFNEQANEQFAKTNDKLQNEFYKGLRETGLFPSARSLKSSDTHMLMDTRTMAAGELGGSRPVKVPYTGKGASVDLHESAVNNTFSQMDIAGKTMTEKEFGEYLRDFFNKAFGLNLQPKEEEESYDDSGEDSTAFVFAESDPLLISFAENEVVLTITAGLKQEGDDDIPTQRISVPLTFTMEGEIIVLDSGKVGVSPVDKPESLQLQIARAGIMRGKIGNAIKRKELDANIQLGTKTEDTSDDKVITVKELAFLNGWARIVVE